MSRIESLLQAGALIDKRYEVAETLGAGGMGWVLRVRDQRINEQEAALKLLHPHLASTETAFQRFKNEVSITRRLSHPYIVQTFEYGRTPQGLVYLTMEYVQGGSIKGLIEREQDKLPTKTIEKILSQIIYALEYAHLKGVIHRDLKPDNILITDDHRIKIADFGLAQLFRQESQLTRTGCVIGTPLYISPEQIQGGLITETSDIYSLGIMLYELASGKPPFQGETFLNIAEQHLKAPLPKLPNKGAVRPNWYLELIKQCTRKAPKDRFQTMGEIREYFYNNSTLKPEEAIQQHACTVFSSAKQENAATGWLRRWMPSLSISAFLFLILLVIVLFTRNNPSFRTRLAGPILKIEHLTSVKLGFLKQILRINQNYVNGPDMLKLLEKKQIDYYRISMLIYAGLNPREAVNPDTGNTLLHHMSTNPQPDVNFLHRMELVLDHGADVNQANLLGVTPLHLAVGHSASETAELLLSRGADPNSSKREQLTPLFWAVNAGNIKLASILLLNGADPRRRNHAGETAAHIAAKKSDLPMIQLLFKYKTDPSAQDHEGFTPLQTSIGRNIHNPSHKDVLELLIQKTPLEIRDQQGRTALEYALETGDKTALALLRDQSISQQP